MLALLANHDICPGSSVGILINGSLGHLGIKFAKFSSCHVVALSSSARKEQEVRRFGADEFIVIRDENQLKSVQPLDMIINTVSITLQYEIFV